MLKDIAFSDMYLEPNGVWYKRSPSDGVRRTPSQEEIAECARLREALMAHRTGMDFRFEHESGLTLRAQRINTLEGDVYICRSLKDAPIEYAKLGMPFKLQRALLDDSFRKGGLILWTGGTGAGKSMSQASWLTTYMTEYGGTACTVENPIEIRLQGQYSNGGTTGTIYQTEVQSDEEFGAAISRLLRAAPSVIMLGEIRDAAAAARAVIAGASGQLVSATLHGNNIPTALERLRNMLREAKLDNGLLADSLCAIVHQSMTTETFMEQEQHHIAFSPLIVSGSSSMTAIRSHLRQDDLSSLASELSRQHRNMLADTPKIGGF